MVYRTVDAPLQHSTSYPLPEATQTMEGKERMGSFFSDGIMPFGVPYTRLSPD